MTQQIAIETLTKVQAMGINAEMGKVYKGRYGIYLPNVGTFYTRNQIARVIAKNPYLDRG